jgi:hypothetical protein
MGRREDNCHRWFLPPAVSAAIIPHASQEMQVTHGAVSQRIKRLEEHGFSSEISGAISSHVNPLLIAPLACCQVQDTVSRDATFAMLDNRCRLDLTV